MNSDSTNEHYAHRADLAGEHKFGDAGQFLLMFLFIVTWILDTFLFKWTIFLNTSIPLGVRIAVGSVILVFAGYLAKTTLGIVFGEKGEHTGVIRTGPYNIIRHPMYLSEVLAYLGILCLSISLLAAVIWLIAIAFGYFLCRFEEGLLLKRFGEEYKQYMRDVPLWFPRIGKS
ncbi:MAG: isoprenylcysteine carboxylmethyltransferase family protein [Anaerolineaceae bacterium]|nr:isoprenylcysteine carboxylmethyltransferase family protein [Anaerolineaceae bacterium]